MTIRQAQPGDFPAIYDLVKTAFATAQVSDGAEQEFVLELRAGENYLPDLEFVAEEGGALVGHVMLTRTEVIGAPAVNALLVAPLCVALEHRSTGLGSKLMEHGLSRGREAGFHAAFLVGDPNYYGRFGFRRVDALNIENDSEIPDQYVQGLALLPEGLDGVTGKLRIV